MKAREWAGLTQQQMANRLGIGRRSIVRYEAQDDPPRTVVLSYAVATSVPEWWFDGQESPPDPENPSAIGGYPLTLMSVAA